MMMTTGNKEAEIASGLTGTMINWVDNLAGLRAMAHAMTAPVVVKGYGSAGDGGGGIFLWNDTSTLADNDGTITSDQQFRAPPCLHARGLRIALLMDYAEQPGASALLPRQCGAA